jgi:DNA polymerase-3 subunit delta'
VLEKKLNAEGKFNRFIAVDEARRAVSFFRKTPLEGGWRVVIVDSVDDMNRNASNALLKVLEEPPKEAIIILISHSLGRVIPTIQSRCHRLPMRPLKFKEYEEVVRLLRSDLSAEIRRTLACFSEGRPGYALEIAHMGGIEVLGDLVQLFGSLRPLNFIQVHQFIEKYRAKPIKEQTHDPFPILKDLMANWIARLITSVVHDPTLKQLEEAVEGERRAMKVALTIRPLDRWTEVWDNVRIQFNEAHIFSLDRQQVLMSIIGDLAGVIN